MRIDCRGNWVRGSFPPRRLGLTPGVPGLRRPPPFGLAARLRLKTNDLGRMAEALDAAPRAALETPLAAPAAAARPAPEALAPAVRAVAAMTRKPTVAALASAAASAGSGKGYSS